MDRAIDFIFSHDNIENEENPKQEDDEKIDSTHYKLHGNFIIYILAAIVHLGSSALSGHYVAYIKKQDNWILYNDSKVAETPDPVLGKGYFYLFKRIWYTLYLIFIKLKQKNNIYK